MLSRTSLTALLVGSAAVLATMGSATDPRDSTETPPTADALTTPPPTLSKPSVESLRPVDFHGICNVVAFQDEVWSGSVPQGEAGFDSLKSLGVQTILSVDGALPDLDRARARSMRYVHLPIGYDGFDDARKVELARAVRDLPKPIYIHCHHGKHRSAGASAAIAVSLGWLTPDEAAARMKVSGTAPGYAGLWRCATDSAPIAASLLDAAPADFPVRTMPNSLVAAMVEIDEVHDRLKRAQASGWRAPKDHPDLAPLADAGRLADLYRLLDDDAQLTDVAVRERAMVREWLVREGRAAARLEAVIEAMGELTSDRGALAQHADASLALLGASCKACHQQHRD